MSIFSTDSGVSVNTNQISTPTTPSADSSYTTDSTNKQRCIQCYSMYCKDCQEQQTLALREVEELLTRLEAAEALFPSSQVLGNFQSTFNFVINCN